MANLVKLAFLLVVATGLAKSDSAVPAPETGPRSKIYIEKPVLLEVNHDAQSKTGENPDVQIAHLVDPMPNVDLSKVPMPKTETKDNKAVLPSVQLDPIPLMMMPQLPFGMPQFIQQILDSLKSAGSNVATDSSDSQSSSEESGINGGVRHGSLTILLMKSLKPTEDDKAANLGQDNADGSIKTRKIVMYKFMPRYPLGGKGDPDSDPNFMNMMGNSDGDKKSVHLLGGDHDLKRFDFIKDQNHLLGEDDFDIDRIREQMPLIGSEDSKIESYFPMTSIVETNQDDSTFTKIRNFFNNMHMSGANSDESLDTEFLRQHGEHDGHKQGKNCMMMKFMRFKSSLYFRTVLHLLFFTGLLMILLCLTMLTIRNIKRRRALRYQKSINIATIEGAQTEDEDQDKRRLFRSSGGGGSSKQPLVGGGSFLVQAPPAYDQITIGGSDEKAEAAGYKTKFSKLTNEEDDSTETKSLSSLPDYEQSVNSKEEQK